MLFRSTATAETGVVETSTTVPADRTSYEAQEWATFRLADLPVRYRDLEDSMLAAYFSQVQFARSYYAPITPKSYKGKFKISVEAFLRDPHGLYDAVPVKLADSLRKSREQDCAGFLTRADDSAFVTTPDGVALASASHLNGPGVFSNLLTGNAPLSYNAAQDAIIQGMQAPDYNGDNMQIEGPWQLVVAISNVAIAQNIKNTNSRTTVAVRQLKWDWCVALTGTPMENHLGELWSLFHTVAPGVLGSWEQFRQRFAQPIEREGSGERRAALARLIAPFLLRRTKQEVLLELPARTEVNLLVELSDRKSTRLNSSH